VLPLDRDGRHAPGERRTGALTAGPQRLHLDAAADTDWNARFNGRRAIHIT